MAARACVFLIVLFLPKVVEMEVAPRWIFWNVGQGLWVTRVEGGWCRHFDMGGERAPWAEVMRECRARRNSVLISHWDTDHIGFVGRARYFLPNLCREGLPGGEPKARKRAMVERVSACGQEPPFVVWRPEDYEGGGGSDRAGSTTLYVQSLNSRVRLASNDHSTVVNWRSLLLPGDSSKKMEKIWIRQMQGLREVKVLALGHHGSRTSTSKELLKELPKLRMAIASARKRRYGHPHRDTMEVLEKFKVPVLSTENWGTIVIW